MDKVNQHLDERGTIKSHYFLDTELDYHRIRLIKGNNAVKSMKNLKRKLATK